MSEQNKWWPEESAQHEGRGFIAAFGDLTGLDQEALAERFGEYNCWVGPTRTNVPGCGEFVAEESELQYVLLLPRTVVSFVMAGGRVRRVEFSPKVRRCIPGTEASFGPLYAPGSSAEATIAAPGTSSSFEDPVT